MQKKKEKRIKKENSIVTIEARGDCDPRNLGKVTVYLKTAVPPELLS